MCVDGAARRQIDVQRKRERERERERKDRSDRQEIGR